MKKVSLISSFLTILLVSCGPAPSGPNPAPTANPSTNPSTTPSPTPSVSPTPGTPGNCQQTVIESLFEQSSEEWTVVGDAQGGSVQPARQTQGGNPGAYLSADDDATGGVWYWNAPSRFLGNQSGAYGLNLSFDLKQSATDSAFDSSDVILEGNNGMKLAYKLDRHPGTDWTAYSVRLQETGWKVDSLEGAAASAEAFKQVLGDLKAVWIRGEYREGADTGSLDNVRLQTLPANCANQSIVSRFDTGNEDWRVAGDAQDGTTVPEHSTQGGNPGGHLFANDDAVGGVWYWAAPDRYLGNQAGSYGKGLSFDLKQSLLDTQFDDSDVILQGAGKTLALKTDRHPGTDWTAYRVILSTSSNWKLNDLQGANASEADIREVLGNLTRLWIRGEFRDGADVGSLDNVILER